MYLDLDDTSKTISIIDNAIIVPPSRERGPNNRFQASGVLTAEGELVENSITWGEGRQVNQGPVMPDPDTIQHLPGQHMFGGIMFGHFGHFLVESTTRLWALDELRAAIASIVYTPKINARPMQFVRQFRPLFNVLGATVPVRSTPVPLRVDRLFVPRQGFGQFELMRGSEAYRAYMRRHAGKRIPARGAEKIYISRSGLQRDRGGLIGEWLLEEQMRREGYEIYHPQNHPLVDQVAQYKAARHIVSVDCSPLHLVGFVGNADQKVAIIKRRSIELIPYFVEQLTLFQGIDAFEVDVLVDDWLPHPDRRPGRRSCGEISFSGLHDALAAKGMVSGGQPWRDLTDAEREDERERLRVLHEGTEFFRMPNRERFLERQKAGPVRGADKFA
ncbi:glycosyltransferase family 61 protein [Paracoccus sp. M683]|uniref:glycosyltransferase 61 family protein n=1 Tax=Paracoccus sp. M683 TaxID=2594268 RepID=UPI00117D7B71|nr:glycosyltransferase 61 family protein [Paracoccus sp. M683]TRW98629.1 glycosyltransferase family 61 protein [Paracoccus sp. M683]